MTSHKLPSRRPAMDPRDRENKWFSQIYGNARLFDFQIQKSGDES